MGADDGWPPCIAVLICDSVWLCMWLCVGVGWCRRWFCRACSVTNGAQDGEEEEDSDLSTANVDWGLPPIGWRMAKGRYVEPG